MEIGDLVIRSEDNRKVIIKDSVGKMFEFKTFEEVLSFIDSEGNFWSNVYESLSEEDKNFVKNQNLTVAPHARRDAENRTLGSIIKSGLYFKELQTEYNHNENERMQTIRNLLQHVKNSYELKQWVSSEHSFCRKGIEVLNEFGATVANSFFEGFMNENDFSRLSNTDSFKGAMIACDFQLQGKSFLADRIELETDSIYELQDEILRMKNKISEEADESQKTFKKWIKDAAEKYNDISQSQVDKFEEEYKKWSANVVNLESTYEEKLRLAKPAEYWEKKAKNFKESGDLWAKRLTTLVIVGLVSLVGLLALWIYVQKDAIALGVESLQGVVLFITLLSIYAFAIKAVSKMTFSSYHLQRDAEEREQLTHLYLSLINEGADLDTDSRSIVLQSLFSRVDSGLISGDSSPTMPGLPEIVQIATRRD